VAFDLLRKRLFADAELVAFVHGLRNCLDHQILLQVTPTGTITYGNDFKVESAFIFDRKLLFSLKSAWNAEAKRFLNKNIELN